MKVLFVGGYNIYTRVLMGKFAKYNVDFAVLCGESTPKALRVKHTKYSLDQRHTARVFENYRPDLLLATVAYDGDDYMDSLNAVLSSAADYGLKRLVFLSSTAVYGPQPKDMPLPAEDTPLRPASRAGLSFSMGEELCRRWEAASAMKVSVLRLGGIYAKGLEGARLDDAVLGLLRGENVLLPYGAVYAPLHADDFAEAVMQVVEAGFSPLYNLTSGSAYPAEALRGMLREECGAEPLLDGSRPAECLAARNSLFKSEYNWRERHYLKDELKGMADSARERVKRAERKAEREKRGRTDAAQRGMNLLGYGETVLLFAVAVFLSVLQESTPLIESFDFIVLYLVIIAAVMPLPQSSLALILSCGFLVTRQTRLGYDMFSAILNANTLLSAAQYCILSIAVSYSVQRVKTRLTFAKMEMSEQKREMEMLEQFSGDNLRLRHLFEDQILEYEISLPRLTAMTARLDTLEPERILPETVAMLKEVMGVNSVAAYIIGRRGGRMRLSVADAEYSAPMGQSPLTADYAEIIDALEQDQVYINRKMDPDCPSMASGVKTDGKLAFVFSVWNMPFGRMRLDSSNLLLSITRLAGAALNRAYRYEELARGERYVDGTGVLKAEAFARLLDARKTGGVPNDTLARIAGGGDLRRQAEKLAGLVRENDYLGLDGEGNLMVLLAGTGLDGYRVFEGRLNGAGLTGTPVERI